MSTSKKGDFKMFLKYFPELEPPITLTDESILEINKINKPLAQELIEQFIIPLETKSIDEYTEFIPCFQIVHGGDFTAIVYWKGGLLSYDYILATFDKNGKSISRKIVSGTKVEGNKVIKSVCRIDEDLIIHIIVGGQEDKADYDPQSSQAMNMEILASGDIIFSLQE